MVFHPHEVEIIYPNQPSTPWSEARSMPFGKLKAPSVTEGGSGLIQSGALNPDLKIGSGAVERIKKWKSSKRSKR